MKRTVINAAPEERTDNKSGFSVQITSDYNKMFTYIKKQSIKSYTEGKYELGI